MDGVMGSIGAIIAGLVALVIGGEVLVRGASLLAASLRISPLVIGLTVVAFGTSAPELGVSLQAALSGSADVAVGNVLGSNVFNVLFILGVAAVITPLVVSSRLIRADVPLMVLAALAMWGFGLDGRIARWEGAVLFLALIVYTALCIRQSRRESREVVEEFNAAVPICSSRASGRGAQIGMILGGLLLLGLGSRWLVSGAVSIATAWGVSELVIGLTIVAAGTSLPEVVTSVVASARGQRDIAVGNVVGSNLFNVLGVLGLASVLAPEGIAVSAQALSFDLPVMVAVSALCLPICLTGNLISRTEGAVLLFYYIAYTTLLVLTGTHPEWSQWFGSILGFVVIPLTVVTMVGSVVWSRRLAQGAR